MLPLLVLLASVAGAWYLLIVRPQTTSQQRHTELVERLRVGDHVMTVGGIYGRVAGIDAAGVALDLGAGVTTRIATDGIARIVSEVEAGLHHAPAAVQAPAEAAPVQQQPTPPWHAAPS